MQESFIFAYPGLDSPERASGDLETARVSPEEEEAPNAGVASYLLPESVVPN